MTDIVIAALWLICALLLWAVIALYQRACHLEMETSELHAKLIVRSTQDEMLKSALEYYGQLTIRRGYIKGRRYFAIFGPISRQMDDWSRADSPKDAIQLAQRRKEHNI